jgi:hypothetical protein
MDIRISDLIKRGTFVVRVRLVRDWRFRVGLWLVGLGVRVLRCRLRIERES